MGYRTLIAVGESKDLMTADAGCLMVFCCEDPEVGMLVAAAVAEMAVLDQHMKMVVAHFELDTVALECESLSL